MFRKFFILFGVLLFAAIGRCADFRLATFSVDVTIPIGHPCMGGGIAPAREVADPLYAKGFVLLGMDKPLVLVAFDWCEIRGTSFEKWKQALAEAVGTDPQRVLVTSTHAHDAPVMDEDAEKLLRDTEATGAWKNIPPPDPKAPVQVASVCQPAFNEECLRKVSQAVHEFVARSGSRISRHGKARSGAHIASNRRFFIESGTSLLRPLQPQHGPGTAGRRRGDHRSLAAGIELLGWRPAQSACVAYNYAVHPMSSYGGGKVSADFPGQARAAMRNKRIPIPCRIYTTGHGGQVFRDRKIQPWPAGRSGGVGGAFARRHGVFALCASTEKTPFSQPPNFKLVLMPLGARNTPEHTEAVLRQRLLSGIRPFSRSESAMGLAWYERVKRGHQVEVPAIEFDAAHVLMLLPAEAYVEFQLFAQDCRPQSFVMIMGYGECGPGYIPIDRAFDEQDINLNDWAWIGAAQRRDENRDSREC